MSRVSRTYMKPTAPGKRQKRPRKLKNNSNILHGADDTTDTFSPNHQFAVVDISDMQKSFASPITQHNMNSDFEQPLFDIIISPQSRRQSPPLVLSKSIEPCSLSFEESIAIDTDSDWSDNETQTENDTNETKHKKMSVSVERFRIKSVTVFGDKLSDFVESTTKEIDSDKEWLHKRKLVENELIATEKHYCADLNTLCNEIFSEIFGKKLLDSKYKRGVTSNLPQIAAFHNTYLLPQLQSGDIIQTFNDCSDFLKMYISFVKEYQKILDIFAVHGNKSKNKKLYKFLKQKRKEKKPLTNLLIAPIQRIPRYLLLLTDIQKRTPKDYKDYGAIQTALNKVKAITNHINERQREIENMSQCLQLQSKLRGFKGNLVEPHRKYINQFTFHLKAGKKLKLTQFCVFSDTLIITDAKWKVISDMKMRSVCVTVIPSKIADLKDRKGFELKCNQSKTNKIFYDTQETMNDDCEELAQIVSAEQNRLLNNDMSLFNAGSNAIRSEMERITNEACEEKKNILLKIKLNSKKDSFKQKGQIKRAHTLPLLQKNENIWGRSMRMNDAGLMCVEWKFIDVNNQSHCIELRHGQSKGRESKKTLRGLKTNGIDRYALNKSNKCKFKYDLTKKGKGQKMQVSLQINIKYDSKKKKYAYPMLINGKSYPIAFREWQLANRNNIYTP